MSRVDRSRLPPVGPDLPPRIPAIHKRQLSNGLRVWSIEHRTIPVITTSLLMPVGSAADPVERPGLAAVTADLLDESAGDRTALELHKEIAHIGARFDIDVGTDATVLTFTSLSRFRDRSLECLADMVMRPRLQSDDIERVRELRIRRLAQLCDHPAAAAERLFVKLLYAAHAYGHPIAGTRQSIAAMTRDELKRFYLKGWQPSRAVLVIAGDGDEQELFESAAARFASWNACESDGDIREPVEAIPSPPAADGARVGIVNRRGAAQSELRIGRVAVPRATPDYYALVMLNMVLGGQFTSRLNMNLREAKGLTYGVRSAFDFRRGPGPFSVQTSIQTDGTAAAIREIFVELDAIRAFRPPTGEELARAHAGLTGGYARNFETTEQIARAAVQLALYALPDDELTRFVERVRSIGIADVTAAADRYFDPRYFSTVVVGDHEKIRPSIASLDLGDPVVYDSPELFF